MTTWPAATGSLFMLSHLETMSHPLVGARVQRVLLGRSRGRAVALLKIRVPPGNSGASVGETVHIVLAAGMGAGVVDASESARVRDLLQNGPSSPEPSQWRTRIEGGRVGDVGSWGLAVVREGQRWCARSEGAKELSIGEEASPVLDQADVPDLRELGRRMVDELARSAATSRRDALRRALGKAIARLDRRLEAIRGDLARMHETAAAAEGARLFVAQAANAARGVAKLEAVDWSSGQARPVEMQVDPARDPKAQIDALFKRARRLKQGARITVARLADCEKARASLVAVAESLTDAEVDVDLAALEALARTAAPRDFRCESGTAASGPSQSKRGTPRPPCRTFLSASGARILVGRGAAHNDALTFRIARPHDLWLHARGCAGAHVIVPLDKGQSCPADLLVEAAHLAAHFSDAHDERVAEVEYAPRRYLRKPRGSAPGRVVVDREKVMALRREEGLLEKLLEREVVG
jgi:predicted ribosome quality control (RQC) complex YloA/Tae2 family protein